MFNAKIDLSDLISKINSLTDADLMREIAQAVADEAVVPELAKEPFRSGKKQPFRSDKSRRFFFAALREGQIQVPYVRTGAIGISEKHPTSSGMDVVVPAAYSDLVRTAGKQAAYHAGTWPTDEDIAQKIEGDTAELIATARVVEALDKAGLT